MEICIATNSINGKGGLCCFRKYITVAILFMCILDVSAQTELPKPMLWNVDNIDRIKVDPRCKKTLKKIIKISDVYCESKPIVVTDKIKSFVEDTHYYCSIGGYWWQDSLNPKEYVHKDGERNPMTKDYDASRLSEFSKRCSYLSVAYYITDEKKYFDSFIDQLDSWFINETSFMYPNFEYAAVIIGKNENKGRASGMIQAYSFIDVIESILLVNAKTTIDTTMINTIQRWFVDFTDWAESGRFGYSLRKSNNNTGLAYDVMLTEFYLFVRKEEEARKLYDSFLEKRLLAQIDEEGKQVAELKRTKAFSYSLFNLSHILDFCFIAQYWNPDYYQEHQERIDKAYDFLQSFENNQEEFPYQQKTDWEECKKRLNSQLQRRERLRGNVVDLFENAKHPVSLNVVLN